MLIIGLSGRKQSGKSTAANLIFSMIMSNLEICDKIMLDDNGKIMISDLFGDIAYGGIFDPQNKNRSDVTIKKAFDILDSVIKVYNFADILKRNICMDILNLSYDQCYGSDDDKNVITDLLIDNKPATAREIMQYIGTDIFRNIKSDVWVSATLNQIERENAQIAIIGDCRFPNEVDAIKSYGGHIIRLTRNPFESDHISESILDKDKYNWANFNHVIDNKEYSLYEQSVEIKDVLEKILSTQ
jgi:hypothetical protein